MVRAQSCCPEAVRRGLLPCPRPAPLSPRDPLSTARDAEEVGGQGSAQSYLHPANVNGQDSGEKQHLKEEVRHQAHDGKKTELLEL